MRTALDLLEELNSVDESARIEAKRASESGKSIMQTIIAFANEPGLDGGYLLLGADWFLNDRGDTVYRAVGLPDPDKLQRDMASQCACALNVVLRPEIRTETVADKTLLVVYVPEADVTQKPIYFKATGLPRGAYRRIGSTDQHCVDDDLWVLRGETQPLHGPDSSILADARLDDFDPVAIAAYRHDRARIAPHAEELNYGDEDLLEALGALRRVDGRPLPTLAGIVLFGKPMSLRRLLPMARIDYIRVPGNQWIEDAENRFQSIDILKPLLLALPQAEASIIDELPKGFHLPEGQLHSVQEPILPRKVIREALANAAMHRSYTSHSPTQIIRYSNRIDIRNVGYSLKEPAQLGTPGSRLRNPAIAAVLHDLHLAETKGTGIRAMRRLATGAGLPLPDLHSDRQANEFQATLFLHNLLTEDDHAWLRDVADPAVTADEAKVLIYARATSAVDNTACRDLCGLDTLAASLVLRRLRDRGLLEKQGSGSRTYYVLTAPVHQENILGIQSEGHSEKPERKAGAADRDGMQGANRSDSRSYREDLQRSRPPESADAHDAVGYSECPELPLDIVTGTDTDTDPPQDHSVGRTSRNDKICNPELATFAPELATFAPELATFAPELATLLATLRGRASETTLREGIRRLCARAPLTVEQLAALLGKNRQYLRNKHLIPMVRDGTLHFRYPESAKHPHQAYVAKAGHP